MKIIKKLFIKNYQSTKDDGVRLKYGQVASIFGLISNSVLFILKIFIGVISGSITIISDAINNFSDICSCGILLFGFKLSNKPADRKHPFGHARIEQIMALIISVMVLMIGAFLTKTSLEKIISNERVIVNTITFVILAIAVAIKFLQMLLYKSFAKEIDSPALKASAIDSRNDCLITFMTIVAMILISFVNVPFSIDGIFGLAISIFIIINSLMMIKEVASKLLGESLDENFVKSLEQKVLSYEGVLGIHDFNLHSYGTNKIVATIHIEMDGRQSLLKAHNTIDKIERDFMKEYNIDLSIHLDPVQIENKFVQKHKENILRILKEIDSKNNLHIHDFRINFKKDVNEILFDVQVPFGDKITLDEIQTKLNEEYSKFKKKYIFLINVDRI